MVGKIPTWLGKSSHGWESPRAVGKILYLLHPPPNPQLLDFRLYGKYVNMIFHGRGHRYDALWESVGAYVTLSRSELILYVIFLIDARSTCRYVPLCNSRSTCTILCGSLYVTLWKLVRYFMEACKLLYGSLCVTLSKCLWYFMEVCTLLWGTTLSMRRFIEPTMPVRHFMELTYPLRLTIPYGTMPVRYFMELRSVRASGCEGRASEQSCLLVSRSYLARRSTGSTSSTSSTTSTSSTGSISPITSTRSTSPINN